MDYDGIKEMFDKQGGGFEGVVLRTAGDTVSGAGGLAARGRAAQHQTLRRGEAEARGHPGGNNHNE